MTVHDDHEEIIDLTGYSESTLPEWDQPLASGHCLLPFTDLGVTRDNPCNPHNEPTGKNDVDDEHALIVYSRFTDHDSHELRRQFQQTAQSVQQGICRLHRFEWHAHCVSPHTVPLASLSTLLTSCRTTLHTLSLWHVRIILLGESFDGESATSNDDHHHNQDLVRLVTALASLQCLQHLTWEPLPSCLWNGWDPASVRPTHTTRPLNSSSCASPSVLFWKALTELSALKTVSFSRSRTDSSSIWLRPDMLDRTTNMTRRTDAPSTDPSNTTTRVVSPPLNNDNHNLWLFPSWMARLQQLNLIHVPLTHSQCQLIAQGLSMGGGAVAATDLSSPTPTTTTTSNHHQLKKLDLSSSTFVHGIADCLLLLHALRYNRTVTCLDLDSCRVVVDDDEQETETATNLPRHDETRTTTKSLTHTPWIRQRLLQTLSCVLEESNTTLTSVSLVSSSSLLVPQSRQERQRRHRQQQVVPLRQQSHNRNLKEDFSSHRGKVNSIAETVPFLLSLNRSGLRQYSLLEEEKESWQHVLPHVLFHTVRHSPTVTFQLVQTIVVAAASSSLMVVPPPPPPGV